MGGSGRKADGARRVNKGDLKEGVFRAAQAGHWEEAKDLFPMVVGQLGLKDTGFWDFLRLFQKNEEELRRLRDEAEATRGSGTRGYVSPELDCPGRHRVQPFVAWDDGFACSLCESPIAQGANCLGCRLCDHDVCPGCIDRFSASAGAKAKGLRRKKEAAAVAKAVLEPVEPSDAALPATEAAEVADDDSAPPAAAAA
eukprot:gnl/TRDRNA2_/TRDRNA2_183709_c0_seq1.p1 gnl/TRDRNA2_/TRDRNA2_183709_c0~~gnl/TRDRNA2_/TRDRNA2_183709_c0_seq1.p1  ORF type:complete len:198 (+),score=46.85 gnl/TRDRNA2_/TRDRNA2_183709_c0_seq1:51-644(+)